MTWEVGDRVWYADVRREKASEPCPLCLGEAVWTTRAPNGHEFDLNCPACTRGYTSDGLHHYYVHSPNARSVLIERVEQDATHIRYAGDGFYTDDPRDITADQESAEKRARERAEKMTADALAATAEWIHTVKKRRTVYRHRMRQPYDYAMLLEDDLRRVRDVLSQIDDPRAAALAKTLEVKKR